MKKKLSWCFIALLVLTATVSFTSCKDDDNDKKDPKSQLVGTWVNNDDDDDWTLVFKSNGTGTESYDDDGYTVSESFTWTATDKKLIIRYDDYDDVWEDSYEISGNRLFFDDVVWYKKK